MDGSRELIPLTVEAGEVTSGVDINDWSASPESYPPDPLQEH